MRSIFQILNLVVDGQINTPQEGAQVIAEESAQLATAAAITQEEAQARLLHNIGYASGYLSRGLAYRVLELYQTTHPVFGAAPWPSSEEIFKMGLEGGQRK